MITQKNLFAIWRFSKKFNIRFNHKILATQDVLWTTSTFSIIITRQDSINWQFSSTEEVLGKINKTFSPESTHLESIQFIHYLPHKYPPTLCCCCQRFMDNLLNIHHILQNDVSIFSNMERLIQTLSNHNVIMFTIQISKMSIRFSTCTFFYWILTYCKTCSYPKTSPIVMSPSLKQNTERLKDLKQINSDNLYTFDLFLVQLFHKN